MAQESPFSEMTRKIRFADMFPSAEKAANEKGANVIEMSMSPASLALTMRNDIANQADVVRLQRYYENWRFYLGQHWITAGNGEQGTDGVKRITSNYIKAFVNKLNRFLNHEGFNVVLPSYFDKLSNQLNKIWQINNHKALALNIGLNGCITGDGWLRINFVNDGNKKSITFSIIDSSLVFPYFNAFLELEIVEIRHPIPNADGSITMNNFISEIHNKKEGKVTFVKKTFKDRTLIAQEPMKSPDGKTLDYTVPVDSLLMFHLPNYDVASAFWGMDDVYDIKPLNKEINDATSSVGEIIEYMEKPVTVVKGASIKNLDRGSRKVWSGIPKDGDVFNLSLNTDLPASQAYLDRLKATMHDLSGVPLTSLGQVQAISNTSGIALHYQNMPLMEVRADKITSYGTFYKNITITVMKLLQWMKASAQDVPKDMLDNPMQIPMPKDGEDTGNPVQDMDIFFPNPLPRDEILLLNQIKTMFELDLIGPDKAYRMLGTNASEVQRIRLEKKENKPRIGGAAQDGSEPLVPGATSGDLGGANMVNQQRQAVAAAQKGKGA